jgi:hypothetical protein
MARSQPRLFSPLPTLLLAGALSALGATLPGSAEAGPMVRRAQERRACQEFATKLQQAGGNPAMAQQVYQQGVLQLVARFGENPCGDIPAPTATAPATAPAAPASAPPASTAPASSPARTAAPAATTPAVSTQQQQACQQFAGKVQASASSGGAAAAQQTYSMGLQKLTGMFGANPCPSVRPPQ